MDDLIIVSVDSHATMPATKWTEYLEARYHDHIPAFREDNDTWTTLTKRFAQQLWSIPEVTAVVDPDDVYHGGLEGLWDADARLAGMDREGIAAEYIFYGDHRSVLPFVDVGMRAYDNELHLAGLRAYHRWAADEFGSHLDRLKLVGAPGFGHDMDAIVAELHWLADHGFAGIYAPDFIPNPANPPLFDEFWEPYWSACEERGLPLFVHAGHGVENGTLYAAAKTVEAEIAESDDPDSIDWAQRYIAIITTGGDDFFADPRPRRPMWQLMFGGVFDRHPNLKLVLAEVRADWLPATLEHLDETFTRVRDHFPAQRLPSEYWTTNCFTSLSFVHRAEVEMRHEIGIDTLSFGRDFPHEESTWPNTVDWLRDAFAGVPEDEVRKILGENAIRFFGLDREALAEIAHRIGPKVDDVLVASAPELHPILLAHFDGRGGYLRPAEGASRLPEVDAMLRADLAGVGIGP